MRFLVFDFGVEAESGQHTPAGPRGSELVTTEVQMSQRFAMHLKSRAPQYAPSVPRSPIAASVPGIA
eukprot:366841-Rhodomonas_salina.5